MPCQQCLLPLCLWFILCGGVAGLWVSWLSSLSSSASCTNCLDRSEIFRLLDLIFASQGLNCGVLLPSRRVMLQRNIWRIQKPMGDCDLPNEGNMSLHGAPTQCHSVCLALIEVPDCQPLQEPNLLWKSLQFLSFSSHKGIPWWIFVSPISTWISELEYVGKGNP